MQNLDLSYEKIRENLIDFLKRTNEFRDYNFSGSGISTLIGLLAYNTHYIGYYTRMLLNEAFVDSAKLRESLLSKAKLVGYIPKNAKSATAELFVKVQLPTDPENFRVIIPRGSKFSAVNDTGMKKIFTTIDDFVLYNREVTQNGEVIYKNTIDPLTPLIVYEGELIKRRFLVDNSIVNQRFIIPEKQIDYTTIRVKVYESENSTTFRSFELASFESLLNNNNNVFFISTNENGLYEIFFGNGVLSSSPITTGNVIEVEYISSSGEEGNGAGIKGYWVSETNISGRPIQIDLDPYPGYSETIGKPISSGGMNEETVEDLRFSIPRHYRRQNRIVTAEDYKSILLSEYRNIESINVWGGEDGYRKEFGKIFISAKPKYANRLSDTIKKEIKEKILKKYGTVGIDAVFVDPEFIKIDIEVHVSWDKKRTNLSKGEIETIIINAINEYNTKNLNVFETSYSEVDLLNYVRNKNDSIRSLFTFKTLTKELTVRHENNPESEVIFGNEILEGIESSIFKYSIYEVKIVDKNGKLFLVLANDTSKLVTLNEIGTIDYKNGILRFKLPKLIQTIGDDNKGEYGIIRIHTKPKNPDINTFMNNIVTINRIKVIIKDV